MRVALDVTPAARQRAGIGRYTRELAKALLERRRHAYVPLILDRRPPAAVLDLGAGVPVTMVSGVPARLHTFVWHRLGLPLAVERWTGQVDVFHATDFLLPPLRRARGVVTVHDLSFMRHPERADPRLQRHLAATVPGTVRRAAHVLADSANTRRDVVELLGLPPERVTVAYPGVGSAFRRVTDPDRLARVRAATGLGDRPFILGVGTLEPRKDWPTLIAAYRRAGPAVTAHDLVIAGGHGWLVAETLAAAGDDEGAGCVRLVGFVPDADLPALLSAASAFAFPSLYEGFGLPPLEALACGVPTVVADTSSLPEVVGDAALGVPAGDVGALSAALERLVADASLRADLAARGPAQAARFTWAACAEAVEGAYAAALEHDAGHGQVKGGSA